MRRVLNRLSCQMAPIIGHRAAALQAEVQQTYLWFWCIGALLALPLGIAAELRPSAPLIVAACVGASSYLASILLLVRAMRRARSATQRYVAERYGFHPRFGVFRSAEEAYTMLRLDQLYQASGTRQGRLTEQQYGYRFTRRRLISSKEEEMRAANQVVPPGPPDPALESRS